jgi:glycosyltransferase involved in cell wall biosynthesis
MNTNRFWRRATAHPTVSIVMPVYNGAQFLRRAVESILRQTLPSFAFIIVDDGSTDATPEVLEALEALDPRVQVLHQQHSGLISALNNGCRSATGELIARIDADDIAKPTRLAQQVEYLRSNPRCVLLGSATEIIDSSGRIMAIHRGMTHKKGLTSHLLEHNCIAHSTVVFRSAVFKELGGYRPAYMHAEDYDLFLRMSDQYMVDNLPDVLGQYRIHESQVSAQNVEQQVLSAIACQVAAQMRRVGKPEPDWGGVAVSRDALLDAGIQGWYIDDQAIVAYQRAIGKLLRATNLSGANDVMTAAQSYVRDNILFCDRVNVEH